MRKFTTILAIVLIVAVLTCCLVACGGKDDSDAPSAPDLKKFTTVKFEDSTIYFDGEEHELLCTGIPEGANVTYTNNKGTDDGVYNAKAVVSKEGYETKTLNATLTILLGADRVVEARENSVNATQQNYDFNIHLNGTVYNVTATADYDGKYRYNRDTEDLAFKRVTSGALLYDAIEYIYNTGSSKIKIVANEDGEVKRTSVVPQKDEELNLLNIPFAALVNHIDANNLTNITKLTSGEYQYSANLALASDNETLQKIFDILAKLGTKIEMSDVSLSNPASGIDFYFSMNDDKTLLTAFEYSAEITIPVKGVPVTLELSYKQKDSTSKITIPSTGDLIVDSSKIANEIATINNAINALKNSSVYSIDMEAVNEFDPGFSTLAIVDKYLARMYKTTNGDRVDFNHSYEYKAHSEEDGAETYKYTIGNIQDGTVHMVSRKGSNEITALDGVSVDTQFNYLLGAAMVDASDVDCIKKVEKNGSTFYYIYTKTNQSLAIKDTITGIINSNDAEGVVDVNNYFNSSNYTIKDAEIVIELKEGALAEITVNTKITYNPTGGEHTENNVTLTNTISVKINENLDKAAEYEAPKSTTTGLSGLGLNNTKFYIR